ncbi:hypothetical protein GCM10008949_17220 [Deinococcus humi]|nr:hypothetical protein GCM10008949_17220 [Deinococcus humi]
MQFLDTLLNRGELLLSLDEAQALSLVGLHLIAHVVSRFIEANQLTLEVLFQTLEATSRHLRGCRHV